MGNRNEDEDWKSMVDITCRVITEMIGRDEAYDLEVAYVLNVNAYYEV